MNSFNNQNYRYELKFLLDYKYADILKYKLSLLMDRDDNAYKADGRYYIRSLYFDDVYSNAYYEKVEGLEKREKYRIRFYNFDDSYIALELKGKDGMFTYKKQDRINKDEYYFLINEDYDKINIGERKTLEEFIEKSKSKNLKPDVIVDYIRVAYTYPIADVRITFDSQISSGRFDNDLFNNRMILFDVLDDNQVILEVKYNDFLPKIFKDLIKSVPSVRISMSKFAICKEKKVV